jgi:hypothetical protein
LRNLQSFKDRQLLISKDYQGWREGVGVEPTRGVFTAPYWF